MIPADWTEHFKWESEDQKKGFLALFQYLRRGVPIGGNQPKAAYPAVDLDERVMQICAFFIQKDLDSTRWWGERIENLDKKLTGQIIDLTCENEALRGEIEEMKVFIKS